MNNSLLRLLRGSLALLAILLAVSSHAELSPELQKQIKDAVLKGDTVAVSALATNNAAQRVEIAQAAMAAAKAGLDAGANLVLFDSPESEAAAKAAGAISPAAAAKMTLATLNLARDFAPASPAEALALAQAAIDVVANQRVRVAAGETTQAIADSIRAILREQAVLNAAATGQVAAIELALNAALGRNVARVNPLDENPPITSLDPSTRSPSGG